MIKKVQVSEVEVIKKYKNVSNRALTAGTLAFFAGFAAVALFGTTVLKVGPILHLNLVEISWLVAIPIVTGSLLRIPFSLLVDKYGRWTLFTQLVIGFLGMVGIAYTLKQINTLPHTTAYYMLLLFGAIAGTSISTFSSGITYVSYFFPQRKQGTALGIFAGIGNSAPGIFTAILPFALASLGLVNAYIAWASFLALMIIIYALISLDPLYITCIKRCGKNKDEAQNLLKAAGFEIVPSGSLSESLKNASKDPRVWALVIMYLTSFGGFEALTEWLPTYWKSFMHVTSVEAGILTGVVYSLVTALIRIFGGWSSDKFGGEKVALISYIIMILGSIVFIMAYSIPISVSAEIIMAIGMGIANGAVYKLVPRYSPKAVSGASGLVGGLGSAGGLLIPPVMGYIASATNFPYAFTVFTILGIVSVALSVTLWKIGGNKNE
ncbi:MFS transporter [Sulfolobus tengchongensis]|uniref:MFS transporter n=1 Tax=Sulfolobus tengchongensis TaxID=207809 RepID=A0AAX4KYD0_9CREN